MARRSPSRFRPRAPHRRTAAGAALIVLACAMPLAAQTQPTPLRVGVLAYRGDEAALTAWQPTAEYLSQQIPVHRFEIVPLDFKAMDRAVQLARVDFITTNPAHYVELETFYGATRIATLKNLRQGIACKEYGGVILTRADRTDIQTLRDLRGKWFVAYDQHAFGGWWMQWRELLQAGIDPHRDMALTFSVQTQDDVVFAVRDARFDAGAVRTDQLERMVNEGKIDRSIFKVLNEQPRTKEFPFVRSTRLYPEWPLAALRHTDDDLAQQVAIALLKLPRDHPASRAAHIAGWTVPLSYAPVHDLLRELRLGPYERYGEVGLRAAVRQHWGWVLAAAMALLLMGLMILYLLRLNQRLGELRGDATPHQASARTPLAAALQRAAGLCAAASFVIGLLVLLGWSLNNESLKRILPGLVAMNPMTAVGFALLGTSLWLRRDESVAGWPGTIARLGAALIVLMGVVKLAGYFFPGADLSVDQWLFAHKLNDAQDSAKPNQMAPNTALCFVLVGAALGLLDVERRSGRRPAQFLALASASLALLAVLGYAYGVRSFYGLGPFIPMAVHTAGAFLVVSLGVLCVRPDRGLMAILTADSTAGVIARRLLPATLILPAVLSWLQLTGERAGLYGTEFGISIVAVANIALFMLLVWWNASFLHHTELERRRAEELLRASEQRMRLIVEMTYDAFVAMDSDGKIIDWNPQAQSIFGWSREEALGRWLADTIIPLRYREAHRMGLRRFLQTGEGPVLNKRIEISAVHRDGHEFPVELTITPIKLANDHIFSAFVHDITERKQAETQLHEKNRQLQEVARSEREAHEVLKSTQSQLVQSEKLAALGQMVAGVAHEINNPLAFVSNNVAVLQRDLDALRKLLELYAEGDEVLRQQAPELAERIGALCGRIDLSYTLSNLGELLSRSRDGLGRIRQIVRDLRDFARLDESQRFDADLNAGIESTVNIIRGAAKKKHVEIQTQLAPLPPVACFAAKINQVVMNLLANAVDASADGGQVTVRTQADTDRVRIDVIDTGSGIDPAIRARIFDPFFTTKPPGRGTGLGLSISYGIVRDHGGSIEVESQPGKGSCFSVSLPLRRPSRSGERGDGSPPATPPD